MLRIVIVAAAFVAAVHTGSWQDVGVLQIKVVLVDADRKPAPVPRHALLISDNPASAPPRRVVTSLDGTATVRLRPGNYTVESDQPVALDGKSYEWRQDIDIAAGRDTILKVWRLDDNVLLTKLVPRSWPPNRTTEPGMKLEPVTVTVRPPLPAEPVFGLIEEITGSAFFAGLEGRLASLRGRRRGPAV